jgi:hybrid cluster-associated redox disulfide protein
MKDKKITGDLTFYELISEHPKAAEFLMEKGMMCGGCPMAQLETVEQGALAHGIDPKKLIKELNGLVGEAPQGVLHILREGGND